MIELLVFLYLLATGVQIIYVWDQLITGIESNLELLFIFVISLMIGIVWPLFLLIRTLDTVRKHHRM